MTPNPTVKFAALRWDCTKAQPLTFTFGVNCHQNRVRK